ncbi:MAG: HepT-like ribonuclease domain-containing protein [Prolixibacteraceae bacterium]
MLIKDRDCLINIVAHDYFGVDAEEVWQIIHKHLRKIHSENNKSIIYGIY